MGAVGPVRKALKIRTAFNILGPLLNPAAAQYALVGVYSPAIIPKMAEVLKRLGVIKALIVHSQGLDELTPMGPADVVEVSRQEQRSYTYVLHHDEDSRSGNQGGACRDARTCSLNHLSLWGWRHPSVI